MNKALMIWLTVMMLAGAMLVPVQRVEAGYCDSIAYHADWGINTTEDWYGSYWYPFKSKVYAMVWVPGNPQYLSYPPYYRRHCAIELIRTDNGIRAGDVDVSPGYSVPPQG